MHWRDEIQGMLRPLIETKRLGVVSDMDGTLSYVVPVPQLAEVTPRNRELLNALQNCAALVAVVSGRGVSDLQRHVGLTGITYVGNHGLEQFIDGVAIPVPEAAAFRPKLEIALRELHPQLLDGMLIEDKGLTASVHYRQSPDHTAIETHFLPLIQQIAAVNGLTFFQGRMIFELRPPVQIDKGTALLRLVTEHHLEAVVFLGDDTTDSHALMMARELRVKNACYALGLGVESDATPDSVLASADLMVSGVSDVESFLEWLLNTRKASSICN